MQPSPLLALAPLFVFASVGCGEDSSSDAFGNDHSTSTTSTSGTTTSSAQSSSTETTSTGIGEGGAGQGGAGQGGASQGGQGGAGQGGAGAGAGTGGEGAGAGTGGEGGTATTCDRSGFLVEGDGSAIATGDDGVFVYDGYAESGDVLVLEQWFNLGAVDGPQTFEFSGENYADCTTCASLLTDCVEGDCARRFLVQSGTLEILELDLGEEMFSARLTDAVAIEVTYEGSTSIPVPGGETWCVDEVAVQAETIQDFPGEITK